MLVLLSGMPGTGKTTVAKALRSRLDPLPVEHIESDAIRKARRSRPAYSSGENAAVFAEVERRARAALKTGRVAIVDATNLSRRDRRRFVRLARELDAALVAVRVTAPEDDVRRRLAGVRDGFSDAGPEIYDRMKGREHGLAGRHVVVDTRYDTGPTIELLAGLVEVAYG